jgi:hypothetical protein
LRKKPLYCKDSVYTRIENAVTNAEIFELTFF